MQHDVDTTDVQVALSDKRSDTLSRGLNVGSKFRCQCVGFVGHPIRDFNAHFTIAITATVQCDGETTEALATGDLANEIAGAGGMLRQNRLPEAYNG